METSQELAVQIETVRIYPTAQPSIVILKTTHDDGYLLLEVPMAEAQELDHVLAGRDVAHDLALQLLAALGGRIERVVVQSVGEQNDSAILTLAQNKQRRNVAARLGYALVLAVCAGAPLFVTSEVIERVGLTHDLATVSEPAPAEELPAPAPVTTSDQAPRTFAEMTWSFILETLFGPHAPLDLAQPQEGAWTEPAQARELEWDGQPMHAIRLPAREPAWLMVRPELSARITEFIESTKQIHLAEPTAEAPSPAVLTPELQQQVDNLFTQAQNDLAYNQLLTTILMHKNGQLVAWRGQGSHEDALRLGIGVAYRQQFDQHIGGLLEALIKHDPTGEPVAADSKYHSIGVSSWGDNSWLLISGFGEGTRHEETQQRLNQLQKDLEALLPQGT